MFGKEYLGTYQKDLEKVYPKNAGMIKYCIGKTAGVVALKNNRYFTIEKKKIEKDFCFGYSLSRYDSEDYDRANAAARHASKSTEYFVRQNMKAFTDVFECLDNSGYRNYMPVLYEHYYPEYGCPNLCALSFRRVGYILDDCGGSANLEEIKGTEKQEHNGGRKYYILTDEEKEIVRAAYKEAAAQHEKKVLAYLKRYGLSKVNTWTYWRDE